MTYREPEVDGDVDDEDLRPALAREITLRGELRDHIESLNERYTQMLGVLVARQGGSVRLTQSELDETTGVEIQSEEDGVTLKSQ